MDCVNFAPIDVMIIIIIVAIVVVGVRDMSLCVRTR